MGNRFALLTLVIALLSAGCAQPAPSPHSAADSGSSVVAAAAGVAADVSVLRDDRASAGIDGDVSGPATGGVLPSPAQYYRIQVGTSTVGVYRFPTARQASVAASEFRPDGSSLPGPAEVEWKGRPHFFKRDRLIVLYLSGRDLAADTEFDTTVLRALRRLMGPQFAGG
jgi:hypothetical protein